MATKVEATLRAHQASPSENVKYALMERLRRVLPRQTADAIANTIGVAGSFVDPVEYVRAFDGSARDFRSGVQNKNYGQAAVGLASGVLGVAPIPGGKQAGQATSKVGQVLADRKAPAVVLREPDSFTMAHSSPKSGIKQFNWRDNLLSGEGAAVYGSGLYGSERVMQNRKQGYEKMARRKGEHETYVDGQPINQVIRHQQSLVDDLLGQYQELSMFDPDQAEQIKSRLNHEYGKGTILDVLSDAARKSSRTDEPLSQVFTRMLKGFDDPTDPHYKSFVPEYGQKILAVKPRIELRGDGSQYLLRVNAPQSKVLPYDKNFDGKKISSALLGRLEERRDKISQLAGFKVPTPDINRQISGIHTISSVPSEWPTNIKSLREYLGAERSGSGMDRLLSDAVQDSGYAGWKYADAWSRGVKDPSRITSNYVIADDTNLVEVLKERQLNKSRNLEW